MLALARALLAGCALVILLAPPGFATWRQEIAGTLEDDFDIAYTVAVDGNGDVAVGGAINVGDNDYVFAVLKFDGATGAELWRQELPGTASVFQGALSIATDAAGDVIAAGEIALDFTVVKFDGATGAEVWRQQIDGTDNTFNTVQEARAVAVDAAGDVVAVGFLNNLGLSRDFVAIKLDGATGAELWRQEIDGGDGSADRATAVALDATGDVIASGRLGSAASFDDFAVIKFDGTSGTELWRYRTDGTDGNDDDALSVAVDSVGDVAAAGVIINAATEEDYAIVKINGVTGAEIWRHEIEGGGTGQVTFERAVDVAVDSNDDVVAIGDLEYIIRQQDLTVIKFAGASGTEMWRREIDGAMLGARDAAYSIAVDSNDDVVAAGRIENGARPDFDFSVLKFDGSNGAELWRQHVDGEKRTGPGVEEVRAVTVDAADDVVAVGFIENDDTDRDLTVVKFDGATGVVGPVAGGRLQFRDQAGRPEKRKIKVKLGEATIQVPAPGSADDPMAVGAEIVLLNPDTLESAAFFLPPGGDWHEKAPLLPEGQPGFVYKDNGGDNGPCSQLRVQPKQEIKITCAGKKALLPFSLDEPTQGTLIVTIRFGSAPVQCGVFGGSVNRDLGTSNPGPKGLFRAVNAPAALGVSCP